MRTRVKICGITRVTDIQEASALGADAVGLVFYPASPRAIGIAQAAALAEATPAFVTLTGLFVDAEPDWVRAVLAQVPLQLLQFHGQESAEYCASFARPWLKAIRVPPPGAAGGEPAGDLAALAERYAGCAALLFDTFDPQLPGGTGQCFDWTCLPRRLAERGVLAGGLTPENVARAIVATRPFAVDVSGGVESAKGIKDRAKLRRFFQGVRDGDQSR